jgi:hypothetical protein
MGRGSRVTEADGRVSRGTLWRIIYGLVQYL